MMQFFVAGVCAAIAAICYISVGEKNDDAVNIALASGALFAVLAATVALFHEYSSDGSSPAQKIFEAFTLTLFALFLTHNMESEKSLAAKGALKHYAHSLATGGDGAVLKFNMIFVAGITIFVCLLDFAGPGRWVTWNANKVLLWRTAMLLIWGIILWHAAKIFI